MFGIVEALKYQHKGSEREYHLLWAFVQFCLDGLCCLFSLLMDTLKGHTILLVDDEQDILNFLSYNLKKEGYKVFTASNGEEGVRMVQQIHPSLILMDVMMPKMDGIEFL